MPTGIASSPRSDDLTRRQLRADDDNIGNRAPTEPHEPDCRPLITEVEPPSTSFNSEQSLSGQLPGGAGSATGDGIDPEGPPRAATRSAGLLRPAPRSTARGSNPTPSSSTAKRTPPCTSLSRIVAEAPGPACLAAFWRHSKQRKHTASSTASEWRPSPASWMLTGMAKPRVAVASAARIPYAARTWGYMPPARVRSSSWNAVSRAQHQHPLRGARINHGSC